MSIRIAPLPREFLARVRTHGIDDQDQPVERYRSATGGEPCRDVLRRARPGEEVILASLRPPAPSGPFRELGPVYVLAEPSPELVAYDRLPTGGDEPTAYFRDRLVLRAYGHDGAIRDAELVATDDAAAAAGSFLAAPEVAFLQARFPTFGCFACKIERAS